MKYLLVVQQPTYPTMGTLTEEMIECHTLLSNEQVCRYLSSQRADAIYVYTGPGTFTGVRLALLSCETFGYIHSKPIYGFDILDLWVAQDPTRAVHYHYHNQVYSYDPHSQKKQFTKPEEMENSTLISSSIPSASSSELIHLLKGGSSHSPQQLIPTL